MAFVKLALFGVAVLGLIGAVLMMVLIAVRSWSIPDLPLHARLNPFNLLALPDRWTPEVRALHTWAVRCMGLFLVCTLLALGLGVLGAWSP